jgi:hypothetical protein
MVLITHGGAARVAPASGDLGGGDAAHRQAPPLPSFPLSATVRGAGVANMTSYAIS